MLENIFFNDNYREVDIEGNLIERPKIKYPYNYDDFTVYINHELKDKINGGCYSDRMFQWDADKFDKCCNEVWGNTGQYFDIQRRTPKQIEKFLSLYFENLLLWCVLKNVVIKHQVFHFGIFLLLSRKFCYEYLSFRHSCM